MSNQRKEAQPGEVIARLHAIREYVADQLSTIAKDAVRSRAAAIRAKVGELLAARAARVEGAPVAQADPADWIPVLSLTTIRNVVGGRFELLKARWIGAGMPLKANRGAKLGEFSRDAAGWRELLLWLLKQGYEVRECQGNNNALFEIRRIKP